MIIKNTTIEIDCSSASKFREELKSNNFDDFIDNLLEMFEGEFKEIVIEHIISSYKMVTVNGIPGWLTSSERSSLWNTINHCHTDYLHVELCGSMFYISKSQLSNFLECVEKQANQIRMLEYELRTQGYRVRNIEQASLII